MNIGPAYFRQRPDCVTRSIGDETIIVPVRSHVADLDSIYTLNEVGSVIWERLEGQTSFAQIVACLCEIYEVTAEEAAQDAADFLHILETNGLVSTTATPER
ncbi:MAG: PqqD family protein [Candidatus Tectomicrobia bacterium]|nr:PqqD family protein [Candidatus Tectomicrobia bacterium]